MDDNIYKIDDSVIAVADMIEEHKEMEIRLYCASRAVLLDTSV